MKESRLQLKIRHALEREFPGSWWFKTHGSVYQPAGIPDLIGCVQGRFIALEAKTKTGEVSLIQSVTIARLTSAGAISCVVTSIDEAIEAVRRGLRPQFGDARLPERFWDKIDIGDIFRDLGPCWLWTGTIVKDYGQIRVKGKGLKASRFGYQGLIGSIGEGLQLDHLCRIKLCVNPNHLEPVTSATNVRRGLSTKLTQDDVERIRSLRRDGRTLSSIGREFGIATPHVHRICHLQRWVP